MLCVCQCSGFIVLIIHSDRHITIHHQIFVYYYSCQMIWFWISFFILSTLYCHIPIHRRSLNYFLWYNIAIKRLCCFSLHDGTEHPRRTRLFPWLLMAWLTASSDYHQPWHCINNVGYTGPCLPCEITSTTSAITGKERKGRYIFMFARIIQHTVGFWSRIKYFPRRSFLWSGWPPKIHPSYTTFCILPGHPHFICLLKYSATHNICMYTILLCFVLLWPYQELLLNSCDLFTSSLRVVVVVVVMGISSGHQWIRITNLRASNTELWSFPFFILNRHLHTNSAVAVDLRHLIAHVTSM